MQRYESKTFISNSLLQRFDGNVNEHSYPVMNFPVDITCKHRRVNPVSVGKLKINAAGEALFFFLFVCFFRCCLHMKTTANLNRTCSEHKPHFSPYFTQKTSASCFIYVYVCIMFYIVQIEK